jgi:hypothetical protein
MRTRTVQLQKQPEVRKMVKKSLVALALVMAAFTGYVFGQKDVRPLAGGSRVYAGDDFGFRAEGRVGDVSTEGRGWVTGKFVVKIEGRWVEARLGGGAMPIKQ